MTDPLDAVLNVNPADPGFRSFLADMFVLNYQWLYTGILVAAACMAAVRWSCPGRVPATPRVALAGCELFLALLLLQLMYVVTRYRDYNNARYVLIFSPVLIAAPWSRSSFITS